MAERTFGHADFSLTEKVNGHLPEDVERGGGDRTDARPEGR